MAKPKKPKHVAIAGNIGAGKTTLTKPMQTTNTEECNHGRQTAGANVRCQEGNNPDRQLRSPMLVKWETMWEGLDS